VVAFITLVSSGLLFAQELDTVTVSGRVLHADAAAVDMYAAIDLLADKLDRLLMKHKEKIVDHHRGESLARSGDFA